MLFVDNFSIRDEASFPYFSQQREGIEDEPGDRYYCQPDPEPVVVSGSVYPAGSGGLVAERRGSEDEPNSTQKPEQGSYRSYDVFGCRLDLLSLLFSGLGFLLFCISVGILFFFLHPVLQQPDSQWPQYLPTGSLGSFSIGAFLAGEEVRGG